jgi:hypothetical protein
MRAKAYRTTAAGSKEKDKELYKSKCTDDGAVSLLTIV